MTFYVKLSNDYSFFISDEAYNIICDAIEHNVSFIGLTMKYDKSLTERNTEILININHIVFIEKK